MEEDLESRASTLRDRLSKMKPEESYTVMPKEIPIPILELRLETFKSWLGKQKLPFEREVEEHTQNGYFFTVRRAGSTMRSGTQSATPQPSRRT